MDEKLYGSQTYYSNVFLVGAKIKETAGSRMRDVPLVYYTQRSAKGFLS